MAKLYFISRVVHEFYRLDEEAFTVGGCFNAHNHEEEVIDVYDSRRLAERRFKPLLLISRGMNSSPFFYSTERNINYEINS